ncbi:unnamed protein product [Toxocara canis]|uniref:Uncharacterized protein n=1 Tax=Toxocara canis TaxID=6265 RepID=A0A183US45_TOXCA|nr:unnamed protein product [Toxocara canis]
MFINLPEYVEFWCDDGGVTLRLEWLLLGGGGSGGDVGRRDGLLEYVWDPAALLECPPFAISKESVLDALSLDDLTRDDDVIDEEC